MSTPFGRTIPKILHLYWDRSPFSLLNLITIKSFRRFHGNDWKIIMYTPMIRFSLKTWDSEEHKTEYIGKDYFDQLADYNVEINIVDFDAIGFHNDVSEVVKSDYFRYWILYHQGGVWSDCDIIYIDSVETVIKADEAKVVLCYVKNGIGSNYFPVGFLAAEKQCPLIEYILSSCYESHKNNVYQCLGAYLFDYVFFNPTKLQSNPIMLEYAKQYVVFMDKWQYLPYEGTEIDTLFVNNRVPPKTRNNVTFGVHWFNGSIEAKQYQNNMSKGIIGKQGAIYQYLEPYLSCCENKTI